MSRRALPIALVAAAIVLAPATASAGPQQSFAAVQPSESFYATTEVVLPDGRHAQATLGEYRSGIRGSWSGSLSLQVWEEVPCDQPWGCGGSRPSGYASLTDDQVQFTRNLSRAAAVDIPVTLTSASWGSGGYTQTTEQVTVSVVFTGTGAITRTADRGDVCGDGSPGCLSLRTSADRAATATVTVDGGSGTGAGSLNHAAGVDIPLPNSGGSAG